MDNLHFLILDYLDKQQSPVKPYDWPQSLIGNFSIKTWEAGGFEYELNIILRNHKQWVDGSQDGEGYIITDAGREALQKEKKSRLHTESASHLELEELVLRVNKLRDDLAELPKMKSRVNRNEIILWIGIVISVITIIVECSKKSGG